VHRTIRPAPEAKKFASLSKAAGFLRAEPLSRPRKGETPQVTVKNSLTVSKKKPSATTRYKQNHKRANNSRRP